jgi:hypothetical protein
LFIRVTTAKRINFARRISRSSRGKSSSWVKLLERGS